MMHCAGNTIAAWSVDRYLGSSPQTVLTFTDEMRAGFRRQKSPWHPSEFRLELWEGASRVKKLAGFCCPACNNTNRLRPVGKFEFL